ncbi:Beta-arrestin-1 [Bagarius yarrelli]|uniref:Beta-arrestin-1 n=1 Tax=Bagarius yarrelli TaxID=175774 RepID=A0A556U808_BAGYA|nr:Beta-arrestin-1 [Bagarius yarrelli]
MASTECRNPGRDLTKLSPDPKHCESWKRHIIRQLKYRDKAQKIGFQDVIRSYVNLLDRFAQRALITQSLFSPSRSVPSSEDLTSLKTATGELAYKVVQLQQEIKIKDVFLERQHARLRDAQNSLKAVELEKNTLISDEKMMTDSNLLLKSKYDALRKSYQHLDEVYRKENLYGSDVLEDMIHLKTQAAARMNHRNERRLRARQAGLHKELEVASSRSLNIEKVPKSVSLPSSPLLHRNESGEDLESRHLRAFSKKRRGNSVSSLEEDLYTPRGVCLVARVPSKVIHTVDAHELGINAVRFSPGSNLLATGGTDRVIKLWDITSGMLRYRGTLDGSNEGITSIEFDSMGSRILAGSYDNSALIWRLDDPVPKFTLTGHSRKVTAARFKCNLKQVVTGSGDRTVKIWDLQRAACIQTIEVLSYCSDLVCSEHYIISCHFDRKIRFWDSSPDGSYLAAGSADGGVYIWNISTGNLETRLPPMHRTSANAVAWSMSGEYMVSVDKSRYGVVLIDPEYLKERKVFITLTCAFRYGREDLDVLGLTFRKDLFVANIQAFPPVPEEKKNLTRLQERLIKKLGEHAYPFTFEIPPNLPCSVTLQPGPEDTGKACGVDFEVKAFCAENIEEKIHKRNSVRLIIRKVQYAPEKPGPQPMAETTRQFLMSDKPLHLEASLDKEVYTLTPFLANNREKRGLALDGKLKHEDTNLASSTLLREGASKEILGIIVSYKVKVKLVVSRGGDVAVELPFTLMHPKPDEESIYKDVLENDAPIDTNLIEFDTNDDDIIFEDFARQRLIGAKDDKEEEEEGIDSPKLDDR